MNAAYEWRDAPFAEFAVIGDPVSHSRSPQMHQAAYRALDLPFRYVAIRIPAGEVAEALEYLVGMGYRGINVTVPHKAEAMAWAASMDPLAQKIGAVNTLRLSDRAGTNTDGPGFLETLEPFGFSTGASALILGAGGSARAVASVLPAAGFRVSIWNRTASRSEMLASEFGLTAVPTASADYDFIVNTTSASLGLENLPIDWAQAHPSGLAYDLVYGETPFLQEAASRGMRTVDGKPLLVAQGAKAFEWWLDMESPRDVMFEAIQ